ncbi:purine-binding chemotaxis protein CheW [Natronocella acetinitrilica]|uniref:Purine-binding chemotaxis protein CheW n=1 Tax=Natronocella acetinitrilica TaxID=414046 RepID=A0AAE3G6E2_9GAMM|nr:chemotaxis protein CheW [Natronocella acetinitrilica]MCP1675581.1 purine-binding chemotaxis protein CheW [Natronocella acetinitrilica]
MNRRSGDDTTVLTDSRVAIRDYLDALLSEVPSDFPDEEDEQASSLVVVESPPTPLETQPLEETVAAEQPPAAAPDEALVPSWGQGLFQALFFNVGELRLAVALTELHSVVPVEDVDITPMPGQPEWQIGLMRYRDRNVRVIDTATMVLPPNRRPPLGGEAAPTQILVVGDGAWGLACHGIGDVVKLDSDEVRWRSRQGKRPWLAGTVIGHLSALVEPAAFTRMLQDSSAR